MQWILLKLKLHLFYFFFPETCSAPSEAEYRKIYSDWCHEFEKYKLAMKTWQTKQAVSTLLYYFLRNVYLHWYTKLREFAYFVKLYEKYWTACKTNASKQRCKSLLSNIRVCRGARFISIRWNFCLFFAHTFLWISWIFFCNTGWNSKEYSKND